MIKTRHTVLAATALALGLVAMSPGYAQPNEAGEAAETAKMASVTLSAADAATAAQTALGGRATSVDLEFDGQAPSYQVTLVLANGTELEAVVDAASGAVSKAPALSSDHGDHGHADGEQEQENETESDGAENAEG